MGVINRIKTIINGSINDMLDKVENPEVVVNQMIRDMEDTRTEMKQNAASAITTVKITEKKIARAKRDQELWNQNAEDALGAGDEDLAKKALYKRKQIDQSIEMLTNQIHDAQTIAERLKDELKLVRVKLQEANLKKANLINRMKSVETKKKLYNAAEKVSRKMERVASAEHMLEGLEGFAHFEEKIEKQMAELDAREELSGRDLEREFFKMKIDKELDEELKKLKEKVAA